MSQISPPIRILLVGAVAFLAIWFTMLRPKPVEVTPAAVDTAAQSAAGDIAQQAEQAADGASAAAQQRAGEAAAPAATAPGTAAAPAPAGAPAAVEGKAELVKAGVPAEVAAALDKKVVALAFVNRAAPDDRRVAGAMKKVYRHEGQVWTHTADIKDVSKYAAITRGADVQQSPSVLVVDRHRAVTALVGYVDSVSINQAVVDALLVDGAAVKDSEYLKGLDGACGNMNRKIRRLRDPKTLAQFRTYIAQLAAIGDGFWPRVRNLEPPKKYRGVHRQVVAMVNADERLFRQFEGAVRTGRLPAASIASEVSAIKEQSRKLDLRLAGLGLNDCR